MRISFGLNPHICLLSVCVQLENLQKRIYQLEEQLHGEMQLKDEMEQKCRYRRQTCTHAHMHACAHA